MKKIILCAALAFPVASAGADELNDVGYRFDDQPMPNTVATASMDHSKWDIWPSAVKGHAVEIHIHCGDVSFTTHRGNDLIVLCSSDSMEGK